MDFHVLSSVSELNSLIEKYFNKRFNVVLVKSNICGFYPPREEILEVVLLKASKVAKEVYLGDTRSTMYSVENRLRELGLYNLVERIGDNVKAVDFMKISETVKVEVPKPHALKKYPFPSIIFKADYLVNVARIGSHPSTTITGALKNLFGLVASKLKYVKYHPLGMDRVVADIAQIVKPDLNIVEASSKIVLSPDPLLADIASCMLIGVDPLNVKHIRYVAEDTNRDLESIIESIKGRL